VALEIALLLETGERRRALVARSFNVFSASTDDICKFDLATFHPGDAQTRGGFYACRLRSAGSGSR